MTLILRGSSVGSSNWVPVSPMETWIEFLVPCFGLAQPWLIVGIWGVMKDSLSVLDPSLFVFQIIFQLFF